MDTAIKRKIDAYAADEYFDYVIYSELAKKEKNSARRQSLHLLAEKEKEHERFFISQVNEPFIIPKEIRYKVKVKETALLILPQPQPSFP